MDGTFSVKVWSEAVRRLVVPPADERTGNEHFLIEASCREIFILFYLNQTCSPAPRYLHSANNPSLLTSPVFASCLVIIFVLNQLAVSRNPRCTFLQPQGKLLAQSKWLKENERYAPCIPEPTMHISYL